MTRKRPVPNSKPTQVTLACGCVWMPEYAPTCPKCGKCSIHCSCRRDAAAVKRAKAEEKE